jgi:hypothetical protein
VDPKDQRPAQWPELDVPQLLTRLTSAGVDFVVVGGIAMVLLGSARLTRDLDICFSSGKRNLEKLGAVLVDLDARLRDVPGSSEAVPFTPDARTLRNVQLLTLSTSLGWLDVHRVLDGVPAYKELRRRAERHRLDGASILVASLDDMMAMKRAADRPVDRADLAELEAIKRLRDQRSRPADDSRY